LQSNESALEISVSQPSPPTSPLLSNYETPPRQGQTIDRPLLVDDYNALSQYDGWTSDSEDASWMAEFQDFTGNFSDDTNSDWEMDEADDIVVGDAHFDP